jgi:rod shape-determining protein MreD
MRWILFSLILLAAALLDGGNLLNAIALGSGHIRPVMLTTVLVFSCLHSRRQDAIGCAFVIGFVADMVSAAMGPHMIIYGIAGTALNRMSHTVSMKRFIHQSIVILLITLLTQYPIAKLEAWKTGQDRPGLFLISLGIALYTALFAPVVWFLLTGIWKRIYPHAVERSRLR